MEHRKEPTPDHNTAEILTVLSILIQDAIAVLKPKIVSGWNDLSEDIQDVMRRATDQQGKVSSIDWYDIFFDVLRLKGIGSEEELHHIFRATYEQTTSRFRKKALDSVVRLIGDLAVAHKVGKSKSPPIEQLSAAHFCMSLVLLNMTDDCTDPASVVRRVLQEIPSGNEDAERYEFAVFHLLNVLFTPRLSQGRLQVTTADTVGRKDITFANTASDGFWQLLRQTHGNVVVCFEVKNKVSLDNDDINQISSRLSPLTGTCGFLIAREVTKRDTIRARHMLPKGEIIVLLQDDNLVEATTELEWRNSPETPFMNQYRKIVDSVV
jgi:hypothetical protein